MQQVSRHIRYLLHLKKSKEIGTLAWPSREAMIHVRKRTAESLAVLRNWRISSSSLPYPHYHGVSWFSDYLKAIVTKLIDLCMKREYYTNNFASLNVRAGGECSSELMSAF